MRKLSTCFTIIHFLLFVVTLSILVSKTYPQLLFVRQGVSPKRGVVSLLLEFLPTFQMFRTGYRTMSKQANQKRAIYSV